MKKQATLLTSLTFTLLLSETDLSSDLLFFFLVGAIPGTDSSLSSGTMLTLIGFAALLVVHQLARAYDLYTQAGRLLAKTRQAAKEQSIKHSLGRA